MQFFSPCISKKGEVVKTGQVAGFMSRWSQITYTATPGKNCIRGGIPPQPPESLSNETQTLFLPRRISKNTYFPWV